jgi:hypothetical protein
MLVKNEEKHLISSTSLFWLVGTLMVSLTVFVIYKSVSWSDILTPQNESTLLTIYCDAEQVTDGEGGAYYTAGEYRFGWASDRSSKHARSGFYSAITRQKQPYGLSIDLAPYAKANDYLEVSVWRKRDPLLSEEKAGKLIVRIPDLDLDYSVWKSDLREGDWERLRTRLYVPSDYKGGKIDVFVFHDDLKACWFDDLLIEKIDRPKSPWAITASDSVPSIDLRISDKGMRKLAKKREQAFQKQILETGDDDWVKGKIGRGDEAIKVKLRLKGDLLDHLYGNKWSFRVKVKAPQSWNRLMTFSLQNPAARNFLAEWVYHRFLEKEDILCPRYDFARLFVNGEDRGTYAWEEHFQKQLLEYRGRREGPIVKFSEDGMWRARVRDHRDDLTDKVTETQLGQYQAADPQAFSEGKLLQNPVLAGQYQLAYNLMLANKHREKTVDEVFDLDRLARYYAITDIFKAYHGLIWHNQRFYYNPVIGKLEPIGFDGFVFRGTMSWPGGRLVGFQNEQSTTQEEYKLVSQLFEDQDFVTKYLAYLQRYSEPASFDVFLKELEDEIRKRERLIRESYEDYTFNTDPLRKAAKEAHSLIFPIKNALKSNFRKGQDSLRVANSHVLPLELVGYSASGDILEQRFIKPIWLAAHKPDGPYDYQELGVPRKAKYLFYSLPGIDSTFSAAISAGYIPQRQTPPQALFNIGKLESNQLFTVLDSRVVFSKKTLSTTEDIIIPKGYKVIFEEGVNLDLKEGAAFISRSPVRMRGSEQLPIRIFSSDDSGNGFTVLQAGDDSKMSYVHFEGLNTLSRDGWQLTGAVTFFESDVDMYHCRFGNNHCEDALNLIRSTFEMKDCVVANTYADGFDADFCKGYIGNSLFINTGNDGMDFSGSVIEVDYAEIKSPGDKGISVGEEATVTVREVRIYDAVLGVASKDLSRLEIRYIRLERCETGFSAYQKKPEYGPARIKIHYYEAEAVKRLHLIEKGSVLILKDEAVETI